MSKVHHLAPVPADISKTAYGNREFLENIGIIISACNGIELAISNILTLYLDWPLDDANKIISEMNNNQKWGILSAAIKNIPDAASKQLIGEFIKHGKICIGNRNHLAHGNYVGSKDGDKIMLIKSTKGSASKIRKHYSLKTIKDCALGCHATYHFGLQIGIYIESDATDHETDRVLALGPTDEYGHMLVSLPKMPVEPTLLKESPAD